MSRDFLQPNIAIVGKTNVGKSTLFNRLVNKKISIAHKTPGATRDCVRRSADIYGQTLAIVDSGGIAPAQDSSEDNLLEELVFNQVKDFITQKAQVIIFVVSAQDGIGPEDLDIAHMLRKIAKPVILVVNKLDHENHRSLGYDFFRLGFKKLIQISALHNLGITELKQEVLANLNNDPQKLNIGGLKLVSNNYQDNDPDKLCVGIALVGKPNTGKSTLLNSFLGEDRVLVSQVPGTTLDAIDSDFYYENTQIKLIDTAGIRRQRSIDSEIEKMAVARTLCAIDRADVACLLINAEETISEQDQKIAGMIFEKKKAAIIVINKWDDDVKKDLDKKVFLKRLEFYFPFLNFAPVIFISAKYQKNIYALIERALILAPRFRKNINTSRINRSLEKAQIAHPPPIVSGRRLRMYFAVQSYSQPPTFTISCSKPSQVHFSYKRYLKNWFRKDLSLEEIPLRLIFKKK